MLSAHYVNKLNSLSVIDHLLDWLHFPFKSCKIRLSIRATVHFLYQSLGLDSLLNEVFVHDFQRLLC